MEPRTFPRRLLANTDLDLISFFIKGLLDHELALAYWIFGHHRRGHTHICAISYVQGRRGVETRCSRIGNNYTDMLILKLPSLVSIRKDKHFQELKTTFLPIRRNRFHCCEELFGLFNSVVCKTYETTPINEWP